jgi:Type II CAAX prenyl endopeptidase Rce1-like
MADFAPAVVEIASEGGSPEVASSETRQRWFELGLVLLVAFGGSFVNALYLLKNGPGAVPLQAGGKWGFGAVHEISSLLVLGYVLARRGLRFKDLGLSWSLRDFGAGLLVIGVSFASYLLGWTLIQWIHHAAYGSWANPHTGRDFFARPTVAVIPFILLNPFFEELIVRAYLMSEVVDLTGSPSLAVAMSVVVQFSYHLYYGWIGAITLSFQFLVLSLYYARSRRAVPIVVAHGVFDILGFLQIK